MTQQQPVRIESRVSAQERRQINTDARIEELAEDMTDSFKQQAAYQVRIEQKIDALKAEIKVDMAAMEVRIIDAVGDAYARLFAEIDQRLPEQKGE